MKTKIKMKGRFDSIEYARETKRGYYFHADEDFREDWEWGKTKSGQLPKHNPLTKESSDKLSI